MDAIETERVSKKRKMFQVAKMPKKSIEVNFEWKKGTKESSTEFWIDSDGAVVEKSRYYSRDSGYKTEKIRTVMKQLEYRFMFDKLYEDMLEIVNMRDEVKIAQLIETEDLDVDVFDVTVERMQLDIGIEDTYASYTYTERDNIQKVQTVSSYLHVGDPAKKLNWNLLDDKMIMRFKCALCVVKTREFFKNIPFMERPGEKSIAIEYRKDAGEFKGWDFSFDNSGIVKARYFKTGCAPWIHFSQKEIDLIQVRPSMTEEIFVALEKYFNSEDEDENNKDPESREDDEESAEKDDEISEDDEEDKYEASFKGRRTVKLLLNGSTRQYNLRAKFFEELCGVIHPIQRLVDTPMSYK